MFFVLYLYFSQASVVQYDAPPITIDSIKVSTFNFSTITYNPSSESSVVSAKSSLVQMGIPNEKVNPFLAKIKFTNSGKLLVHTFSLTLLNSFESDKRIVSRLTYYVKATKNKDNTITLTRKHMISTTIVTSQITQTTIKYFLWWETSRLVEVAWRPLTSPELQKIYSTIEVAARTRLILMTA